MERQFALADPLCRGGYNESLWCKWFGHAGKERPANRGGQGLREETLKVSIDSFLDSIAAAKIV